jgi:hypothetical protein
MTLRGAFPRFSLPSKGSKCVGRFLARCDGPSNCEGPTCVVRLAGSDLLSVDG